MTIFGYARRQNRRTRKTHQGQFERSGRTARSQVARCVMIAELAILLALVIKATLLMLMCCLSPLRCEDVA
jgi:hypothetical protein